MKNINILVEHLQKLSNKKIILVENDDFDIDKIDIDTSGVFVPRRLEGRMNSLIKEKLRELNITKIYPDGSVDVDGDVNLSELGLVKIPIKFNKVSGYFSCSNNKLTSLVGCPKKVSKDFACNNNQLISLEGCPEEIGGGLWCYSNLLTNLKGSPRKIKSNFNCSYNELTSLEGCPEKIGGDLWCEGNPKLKLTEGQIRKICDVEGEIHNKK